MENTLQVVDQREVLGKQLTTYGDCENPLFLAREIAEWVEHSNPAVMLKAVDDDEKVINIVYTLGGAQQSWFLTEDGLYEVLMQSRKTIAKQFKKEVKKILKEVRKNGYYETEQYKQTKAVEDKIDHIEKLMIDSGIIRINVNPRYIFERLNVRYKIATGDDSHRGIHEAIGNYFGITVPYSRELPVTLRDYLIEKVGIDEIQEFVLGIEAGIIVKSKLGHWVNLNGFGGNNVEWNKILREFKNTCVYCGRNDVPLIPEHVVSQYYMARSNPEAVDLIGNIVCACGSCNKEKDKQDVDEFYLKQPFFDERKLVKIHKHQNKYRLN